MARNSLCARHGVDLEGGSPLRTVMTGTVSRRQLRHREVGWGGSPRRNPERTNRNRISGRCDGVSQQWMVMPGSRSEIAWVNLAATGGKISVLPREVSVGLGTSPSRLAATPSDAQGEVSRGLECRPGRSMKGRILGARSGPRRDSTSAERQQSTAYQMEAMRHGATGEGGTGPAGRGARIRTSIPVLFHEQT